MAILNRGLEFCERKVDFAALGHCRATIQIAVLTLAQVCNTKIEAECVLCITVILSSGEQVLSVLVLNSLA